MTTKEKTKTPAFARHHPPPQPRLACVARRGRGGKGKQPSDSQFYKKGERHSHARREINHHDSKRSQTNAETTPQRANRGKRVCAHTRHTRHREQKHEIFVIQDTRYKTKIRKIQRGGEIRERERERERARIFTHERDTERN